MSQENVAVIAKLIESYRRGEPAEARFPYLDPEIVWNPAEEEPSHGLDAVQGYIERWEAEWEGLETIPEEFVDAGDRVVVTVYFRGRGKSSGIDINARLYEVYTPREGKVTRMDEYTQRAEALEAVGLRE